nr:hypothetical protein [Tanacetum cinerariifolium]
PHDSPPRVTSLATDEGSMQHKLYELTDLCTRLQRQQTEMASKIAAQDLEITSLKARIKLLEDKYGGGAEPSREDATIKGRSLETGEEAGVKGSTERGSNDTEELVNVLTSLDAASILTSGVQVTVLLFDSMLVNHGEGSGTPTEPHHTPSPEAQQSPHTARSSPSQLTETTEPIPSSTPTEIPSLRQ